MVTAGGDIPARGFLFDTNVLIAALRGEEDVSRQLAELPPESLFVPAITLGELYFGTRKSARPEENLARFERFAADFEILPCNEATPASTHRSETHCVEKAAQSPRTTSG